MFVSIMGLLYVKPQQPGIFKIFATSCTHTCIIDTIEYIMAFSLWFVDIHKLANVRS